MKKLLLFVSLLLALSGKAQSVVQTINSGSIIASNTSISIGEIVIIPENQNQSSTGIIGILAQVNQQTLQVPELALNNNVVVYPNPTMSKITFTSKENLSTESATIFNNAGQLVATKTLDANNSLDLTELAAGIYLIQLSDKKITPFKIIKN